MNQAVSRFAAMTALAMCLGLPGMARATDIQPGLWSIDVTAQQGDKSVKRQRQQCISPEEAKNPEAGFNINSKSAPECSNVHYWDGTALSWTVTCKGEKQLVSKGKFIFDSATHMAGQIENTLDGGSLARISVDGRRTGECPKDK